MLQGGDVGGDGTYSFIGFEHLRHDAHLGTVDIALMGTANSGSEVLKLSDDIPVMLLGQARRIQGLCSLTEFSVTGDAGFIGLLTKLDIAVDGRRRFR